MTGGRARRPRWRRIASFAAILALLVGTGAHAEDKLRVGKAIQNSFGFGLLDVGIASGVFKQHGFEIEAVTFSGAAKLQLALTSNDIDLGLSTGQDLGFIAKGLPAMTIAATSNAPVETVMLVGYNSPIKTVADLKGKKVAVSNIRGYPSWLTIELSKHQGWGADGITLITTGSQPASIAVLKTKQVDAWAGDIGTSIEMEAAHEGHILLNFRDYVPPFMNTALYATNALIKTRPDLVRGFVEAWFDNIAWARAHRQETVAFLEPVLNLKPATIDQIYARLMPAQSTDGRFDPQAMATMRRAVVELGILETEPDIAKLFTEEFLPKQP